VAPRPDKRAKQAARVRFAELQAFADQLPSEQRAAYLRALERYRREQTKAAGAVEQKREARQRAQRQGRAMPATLRRVDIARASYRDVAAQIAVLTLQHPRRLTSQRWNAWRIAGEIEHAVNVARARNGKRPLSRHTIRDKIREHPDFRRH
jgi:hypothetical protein